MSKKLIKVPDSILDKITDYNKLCSSCGKTYGNHCGDNCNSNQLGTTVFSIEDPMLPNQTEKVLLEYMKELLLK